MQHKNTKAITGSNEEELPNMGNFRV